MKASVRKLKRIWIDPEEDQNEYNRNKSWKYRKENLERKYQSLKRLMRTFKRT